MNRLRFVYLAVALLCVTLGAHYAPRLVASLYANAPAAERAWFYVAQGLKGIALLAIIIALMPLMRWPAQLLKRPHLQTCWPPRWPAKPSWAQGRPSWSAA